MTRWFRNELDQRREREPLDPLIEGARYRLSRDLLLEIWKAACATTGDDSRHARQRFHELAERVVARGGRIRPDIGRRTLIELEREREHGAVLRDPWQLALRPPVPGRDTRAADEARRHAAPVQRHASDAGEVDAESPEVARARARAGGGEPLPLHVRHEMEARLGVPLDRVRIHTDAVAADAAAAVRAEAFTVGEDIFFAAGTFAPDGEAGQRLLAHELTHVVQGWQGRTDGAPGVSRPGDPLEREAEATADRIATPAAAIAPTPPAAPARSAPQPILRRAVAGGASPRGKQPSIRGGAGRGPRQPVPRGDTGASSAFLARARKSGDDASNQLGHRVAEVHARPPGEHAKAHAHDEHHKSKTAADAAHAIAGQADKAHPDPTASAPPAGGKADAGDPRAPIAFKPISDWSPYMPQPLPDQDERERKRIERLVRHKVEADRAQSRQALESLRAAHLQHAAELRAARPKLEAQVSAAQQAALADVAAGESAQVAAVQGHIASVQGQVRGHAAAMKAQLTAAHAATVAKIHTEHDTAQEKLAQHKTKALTDVDRQQALALVTLGLDFLALQASFTDLGHQKAADAIAVGEEEAGKLSGRWDGDKLDAAKKAAHDTADGFASSMPDQASQSYQQVDAKRPEAEQSLRDFADAARGHITTSADTAQHATDATQHSSLAAAQAALRSAIAQIDQASGSTVAALAAQGASQVAAIRQQGQSTRARLLQSGSAARAGVGHTSAQAASGVEGGVLGLIHGARQIEAPDPEQAHAQMQAGARSLDQGAGGAAKGLSQSATGAAHALTQQAQAAVAGMTQTATTAKATATRLGAGAIAQMSTTARTQSAGLVEIAATHKQLTDAKVTTAIAGFTTQTGTLETNYKNAAKDRQTQFQGNVAQCKSQLDATVPDRGGRGGGAGSGKQDDGGGKSGDSGPKDEVGAIAAAAQKAADAVKPWWQKALAVVVSVVVAVVVVMVVTALIATTGPVGAVLVGALAGSLASVAGSMASNLVLGNGLFDGITLKSIAMGAVGGAIGAGLTEALSAGAEALAGSTSVLGRGATAVKAAMSEGEGALAGAKQTLGQYGLKTGIGVANDFVTNQATSLIFDHKLDISVENLVVSLATNGVMNHAKVAKFQADVQAKIKARVPGHIEVPKLQIEIGAKPAAGGGGGGGGSTPPSGEHGEPSAASAATANRAPAKRGSEPTPTPRDPAAPTGERSTTPAGPQPKPEPAPKTRPEPKLEPKPEPATKPGPSRETKPHREDPAKATTDKPEPAPAPAPTATRPATEPTPNRADPTKAATGKPDPAAKSPEHKPPTHGADAKPPATTPSHPAEHTRAPEGETSAPGGDASPAAPSDAPSAIDSQLGDLGYDPATPAKRDQLASQLEQGSTPTHDTVRDTEANQQGLRDLEKLQNDPRRKPAQKRKIEGELAARIREQPEPPGNLARDVQDARTHGDGEPPTNGADPASTPKPEPAGEHAAHEERLHQDLADHLRKLGLEPDQVPFEVKVMTQEEFQRQFSSEKGRTAIRMEGDRTVVYARPDATRLDMLDEAAHLAQSADPELEHDIRMLSGQNFHDWEHAPAQHRLDMFQSKLRLEIDAKQRTLGTGEHTPAEKAEIERQLAQLQQMQDHVNEITPEQLSKMNAGIEPLPPYLDSPSWLFAKESSVHGVKLDRDNLSSEVTRTQVTDSSAAKAGGTVHRLGEPWHERTIITSGYDGKVTKIETTSEGTFVTVERPGGGEQRYAVESGAELRVKEGQEVKNGDTLAEESNRAYRLVEIENNGVKSMREEIQMPDGSWRQRGSESTFRGKLMEDAAKAQVDDQLKTKQDKGEISSFVHLPHSRGGGGFDDVVVEFSGSGKETTAHVRIREVKDYPNRSVPLEEFTAITGSGLKENLQILRDDIAEAMTALNSGGERTGPFAAMSKEQLRALEKAVDEESQGHISVEVVTGPTTKIGNPEHHASTVMRDLQKAVDGELGGGAFVFKEPESVDQSYVDRAMDRGKSTP